METDLDTANIFSEVSEEDRRKLCILWGILLREYKAAPLPLRELMDQLGAKAKARGLTSEKLDSILNAD